MNIEAMNINEEIKNITNYLSKVETSIELDNKKLITQQEIDREKNSIQQEIKDIDNKLIHINNDINAFTNNQKQIISREEQIYNTELQRLKDKRKQIKETKILELKHVIKRGVELYIKKRAILTNIKDINSKIAEFNNRKHNVRREFINSVKKNNGIIKNNKTEASTINNIKDEIVKIDIELQNNSAKKNALLSKIKTEQKTVENDVIIAELALIERENSKLERKRKQLAKYLCKSKTTTISNVSKPLLKNKLPSDYKEYKNRLLQAKEDLDKCNCDINKNIILLEELENTMSDDYITILLADEKARCITRWNKMNERITAIISEYKAEFNNDIIMLTNTKIVLEQKYNILLQRSNAGKLDINKINEIKNNNELLNNIKNRLKYLKNMK
jgi:hypothetical protein